MKKDFIGEELKDRMGEGIPREGDITEGKIVGKGRAAAFIDLGSFGTGIIYGKEFQSTKDELKDLQDGDSVAVKIISVDSEDGYVECSRIQAKKEMAWGILEKQKENEETITVKIEGANKGGLLTKISGIPSFIPSSQLSTEKYPRVEGGDSSKVLKELQKFIGTEIAVRILDLSKENEKIILSEKAQEIEDKRESLDAYEEGDIVEGEVTGIVPFGAFIKFGDGIEGLIHISELDWSLVEDPHSILKEGDVIKAQLLKIDGGKVFLSLKSLKKDPWKDIKEKYKEGDKLKGKVTKIVAFGAFIEIEEGLQGLCHISEFDSKNELEETLEKEKEYDFKIVSLDADQHRLGLRPLSK